MKAWYVRWRARRRLKRRRKAYNRLHGIGTVSVPPKRGRRSGSRRRSWGIDLDFDLFD